MSDLLLGHMDDNVWAIISPQTKEVNGHYPQLGTPPGYPVRVLYATQPIAEIQSYVYYKVFGPVMGWNMVLITTIFLNIYCFRKLLSYFTTNKFILNSFSLIFIFLPYLTYRITRHPELAQVWPIIIICGLLYNEKILRRERKINIWLFVTLLISNYLGVFTTAMVTIFYGLQMLLNRTKESFIKFLKLTFGILIVYLITYALFLSPSVNKAYNSNEDNRAIFDRSISDFVIYSAKPWFYFLPSNESIFLGDYTEDLMNVISRATENPLFQNYFPTEHHNTQIGLVLCLILLLSLIRIKKFSKNMQAGLLTLIFLAFLSFPPIIPYSGNHYIFPSYIIFYVFHSFRVLSRFGILIFILGVPFYIHYLERLYRYKPILLYLALLIILIETSSRYTFTNLTKPTNFVNFSDSLIDNKTIAVYPFSVARTVLHMIPETNINFVNIVDNNYNKLDNFTSCEDLIYLRRLNTQYLLFGENDIIPSYMANQNYKSIPGWGKASESFVFFTIKSYKNTDSSFRLYTVSDMDNLCNLE